MDKSSSKSIAQELSAMPVIVAALGYLVDMYDLFLFSIVRVPSLKGDCPYFLDPSSYILWPILVMALSTPWEPMQSFDS